MLKLPAVQRYPLVRSHRRHALLPPAYHHPSLLAIRVRAVFSAIGVLARLALRPGLLRRAENADSSC